VVVTVCADSGSKRDRLANYLRDQAHTGECYVKSKFIADDVDLSPKEVGTLMYQLQESVQDLHIEKWSNARATTWRIEVR